MSTTIPTSEELRANIRARTAELRALRRLLRLAEAAEAARQARTQSLALTSQREDRRGN